MMREKNKQRYLMYLLAMVFMFLPFLGGNEIQALAQEQTTESITATTEEIKIDWAKNLSVSKIEGTSVTLQWKAQYYTATGFQVYRCGEKDTDYTLIATVEDVPDSGVLTYIDHSIIQGVPFTYKIVPYHRLSDGELQLGNASNTVTTKIPIETTKIKKYVRKNKKVTLKWEKINGVTGYEVWKITNNGKKRVKKIGMNKNSYLLKKVSTKSDTNYIIRAYVRYNGVFYYGDFSEEFTVYSTQNKKIADKFKKLQKKYPSYSYWNHRGKSSYNSTTITKKPCNHTKYATKHCNLYYCPNGNVGLQCYGFAWKMSDLIFGKNAKIKNHKSFNKAQIGDVIRCNGHSAIILEKHKDYVIIGECNIGGTCMILWGRKVQKSELKNATYSHRY